MHSRIPLKQMHTMSLFKKLRKQRVKHNAKHCVIKELHSLLNLFCTETFPMPRHDYGIEPEWA